VPTQTIARTIQVLQILKAYTYQLAVDTWGTIPFSDTQN
jgi:hypothetical protein